jgi:SAM-dependent methyltransferase
MTIVNTAKRYVVCKVIAAFVALMALMTITSHAQTPVPTITPPRDVDVPFVVSAPVVTRTMLEMAKVTKNDVVIDLGSGDGRIIFLAALGYGARGLGVEIDPRLVETALEDTQKLKLTGRVDFRVEDLFKTNLSEATVITMYLLPDVNLQLRDKLLRLKPGTRVVSHDWDMGDWLPDEMRVVANPEKSIGLEKTSKVFLWVIPAEVAGRWCGVMPAHIEKTGKEKGKGKEQAQASSLVKLIIEQRYQQVNGTWTIESPTANIAQAKPVTFRSKITANRFVINTDNRNIVAKLEQSQIGSEPRLRVRVNGDATQTSLQLKRGEDCAAVK